MRLRAATRGVHAALEGTPPSCPALVVLDGAARAARATLHFSVKPFVQDPHSYKAATYHLNSHCFDGIVMVLLRSEGTKPVSSSDSSHDGVDRFSAQGLARILGSHPSQPDASSEGCSPDFLNAFKLRPGAQTPQQRSRSTEATRSLLCKYMDRASLLRQPVEESLRLLGLLPLLSPGCRQTRLFVRVLPV